MVRRLAVAAALLAVPFVAAATSPRPVGFVNDLAELLTPTEEQGLYAKLATFEGTSGNEVVVVTVPSLEGDTIENYAVKLFESWGIGKAKQDNGVLVVVVRDDRQVRIEVGYGLEGALPDAESHRIIEQVLQPAFREGRYYAGLDAAVDRIMGATRGEYEPVPAEGAARSLERWSGLLQFVFVFGSVLVAWLGAVLGRSKSWWAGGVVGAAVGVAVGLIWGFLLTGVVAVVGLAILGLFFDYHVSQAYAQGRLGGRIPWWAGGRSHGRLGGGLGGGFGGFGGGMSGGGGASGRW